MDNSEVIPTPYFKSAATCIIHALNNNMPPIQEVVKLTAKPSLVDFCYDKEALSPQLLIIGQTSFNVHYTDFTPSSPIHTFQFSHTFSEYMQLNPDSPKSYYTPYIDIQNIYYTVIEPYALYCSIQMLIIAEPIEQGGTNNV